MPSLRVGPHTSVAATRGRFFSARVRGMALAPTRGLEVSMIKTFGAALGAAIVILFLATVASRLISA